MQRVSLLIALLLTTASIVIAGTIRDGSLSAYSNGSSVIVRWISDDESGLRGYMIERKSGVDGPFVQLTSPYLAPQGNSTQYSFEDNTAFRTTDNFYQYRVTPVYTDGRQVMPYLVSVRHSVSSVRRTWGSIKAMFR